MERLVFLDESAAKTNMIRLYGRAERGERCVDATPFGHWNTTTMLSSIRLDGSTECIVFPGALNKKLFETGSSLNQVGKGKLSLAQSEGDER
ncbi:MAG: transposase [Deltaproteobacteria bacterium]|nr:transposase [Deltaproteobacteria bacterium]